jgi:hypothetical protein
MKYTLLSLILCLPFLIKAQGYGNFTQGGLMSGEGVVAGLGSVVLTTVNTYATVANIINPEEQFYHEYLGLATGAGQILLAFNEEFNTGFSIFNATMGSVAITSSIYRIINNPIRRDKKTVMITPFATFSSVGLSARLIIK